MNFQITQGSGTIIATDVGGGSENYQKIKLIDATIGSSTPTGIASNPLQISLANTGANSVPIIVDGSGVTQPISALSLPLPTGAATEATLVQIRTDTDNLDVVLSTRASETTLSAIKSDTDKFTFVSSALLVDGSGVTQPVSGTVAATQSGTWTVALSTGSIEIGTVDQGTPNTLANAWPVELTDGTNVLGTASHPVRIDPTGTTIQPISGTVLISNFPATQPVSGTVTANQGTSPWVVSGTVSVSNASIAVTQSGVWSVGRTWTLASGTDSISAVQSGTWNITNISGTISLPTGASTSAKQPALGTAGTASTDVITVQGITGMTALKVDGSGVTQPVSGTITANQGTSPWVVSLASTTITGTVAVTQSTSPWVISGTVTANAGTGSFTVAQATGTNLHTVVDSGSITVANSTLAVTQSGTWTTGRTWTLASGTDSIAAAQSGTWNITNISGTISLPTGASTDATLAKLTLAQGSTTSGETGPLIQGAVTTSAPLYTTAQTSPLSLTTAGALRTDSSATTQPISGTITANAGTGNFTVVQGTGTNLHTVLDSGTLTSITNPLPAGTNVIGHIIADSGSTTAVTGNVTVVQPTGTNLHTVLDSGTLTTVTNPVTVAQATPANLQAIVTPIAITKGTQGTTGFTTQDLKDAGRNYVTFTADAVAGVTSEALLSFTENKQGTTTAAVTSYTVTTGKTLRIQSITVGLLSAAAAGEWVRVKLRHNTAGATTATSPLVYTVTCGTTAAVTATSGQISVPIPDGLEIFGNGTQTIGVSHLSSATSNIESITVCGYEY